MTHAGGALFTFFGGGNLPLLLILPTPFKKIQRLKRTSAKSVTTIIYLDLNAAQNASLNCH